MGVDSSVNIYIYRKVDVPEALELINVHIDVPMLYL